MTRSRDASDRDVVTARQLTSSRVPSTQGTALASCSRRADSMWSNFLWSWVARFGKAGLSRRRCRPAPSAEDFPVSGLMAVRLGRQHFCRSRVCKRSGVRSILPGMIDWQSLGQQMLASIVNRVPMGRLGTQDEIAKAAVFLASDDSTFVTVAQLFVDGGAAQV